MNGTSEVVRKKISESDVFFADLCFLLLIFLTME